MKNYKLRIILLSCILGIGVLLFSLIAVGMNMQTISPYIKGLVADGAFAFSIGLFFLPWTLLEWDKYERQNEE